ncbi:MAG TPA: hypothetical protein VGX03_39000 [Candidatus Binatia bacterium]|nr:hypothetical protein [Candidatus Binatia bacterium]
MSEPEHTKDTVRVVRIDAAEFGWQCPLEQYTAVQWRARVWAVLGTAIEQAQQAVLDLLSEGGGSVLFRVGGAKTDAADCVGVSGLHGLARSIAKEYGRKNIRCNVIIGYSNEVEVLVETNGAITGELLVSTNAWGDGHGPR